MYGTDVGHFATRLSVCIRNGMHPTCPGPPLCATRMVYEADTDVALPGGTCGILPESFLQNSDLITQQDRSKYFKLTPQAERTQNAAPEPFFQRMSNRCTPSFVHICLAMPGDNTGFAAQDVALVVHDALSLLRSHPRSPLMRCDHVRD